MPPVGFEKMATMLINIIIVSIPEELFIVMFALILLNQFDFLESRKESERRFKSDDIARIGLIVLFIAVLSSVFRYYLNMDPGLGFVILVFTLFVGILFLYKMYWNAVSVFKTLICVIISVMSLAVTEMLYIPLVLYSLDKTVAEINSSVFLNFAISLPERIMQFTLLAFIIFKKKAFVNTSVFRTIVQSSLLMLSTVLFLIINLGMLVVSTIAFCYERILMGYSLVVQVAAVVLTLLLPVTNIVVFFGVLFYKNSKDAEERFLIRQDLEATVKDIKRFTNKGKFDKIDMLIDDLQTDIKRVYKNYEKEVKL